MRSLPLEIKTLILSYLDFEHLTRLLDDPLLSGLILNRFFSCVILTSARGYFPPTKWFPTDLYDFIELALAHRNFAPVEIRLCDVDAIEVLLKTVPTALSSCRVVHVQQPRSCRQVSFHITTPTDFARLEAFFSATTLDTIIESVNSRFPGISAETIEFDLDSLHDNILETIIQWSQIRLASCITSLTASDPDFDMFWFVNLQATNFHIKSGPINRGALLNKAIQLSSLFLDNRFGTIDCKGLEDVDHISKMKIIDDCSGNPTISCGSEISHLKILEYECRNFNNRRLPSTFHQVDYSFLLSLFLENLTLSSNLITLIPTVQLPRTLNSLKLSLVNIAGSSCLDLENLESLHLHQCSFGCRPHIALPKSLKSLTVRQCRIASDLNFKRLQKLEHLHISDFLELFEHELPQGLKCLDLSWNMLQTITIRRLPELTNLNLSQNNLTNVHIHEVDLLRELHLSLNSLTSIPNVKAALKFLDLLHNRIRDFKAIDFQETQYTLKHLVLANNRIKSEDLGRLPGSLATLILDHNSLNAEDIKLPKTLTSLSLKHTGLSHELVENLPIDHYNRIFIDFSSHETELTGWASKKF